MKNINHNKCNSLNSIVNSGNDAANVKVYFWLDIKFSLGFFLFFFKSWLLQP